MIKLIIGNKGSGKTKRLIDLVNTTANESKGNVVCVEASLKQSYYAVIVAYCLPVVLIFAILIIGELAKWSETISALAAVVALVPYFLVLYLLRDKIGKRISFRIKRIE